MANTIQIKRSTNNTVPNSNISGGTLTNGELGYSYSADDGSGDEAGQGKLYIGHADGLGEVLIQERCLLWRGSYSGDGFTR